MLAYPLAREVPRPPHGVIPVPHLRRWDMVPPGMAVMDATVATEYGWAEFYNSELCCKCGKVCVCHVAQHTNCQNLPKTHNERVYERATKG